MLLRIRGHHLRRFQHPSQHVFRSRRTRGRGACSLPNVGAVFTAQPIDGHFAAIKQTSDALCCIVYPLLQRPAVFSLSAALSPANTRDEHGDLPHGFTVSWPTGK